MNIKNKKILRITTVSHSLDLLLKGQLKFIGEHGYDVSIACTRDNEISKIEKREKVRYYELELSRKLSPLKDLVSLIRAVQLLIRIKPDIVHTHSPKAGIIGMLASWLCHIPLKIHTVAGLPLTETKGMKRRLLILIEKLTYYCSDYILSNSLEQKKFIDNYIYNSTKVQVIGKGSSNGIDLDYFNRNTFSQEYIDQLRNKIGIEENSFILSFVGRLTNYKGVNELVKATVYLQKKYPNIKLLLIGPIEALNPLENIVLDMIKDSEFIFSVGHQEDIRPYLMMSDVFVFPSYREGFPQSLMQAAAMNLPCIASNINGCNEIIENERTGLLINPQSIDSIIEAVEKLIDDVERRNKYALQARVLMEQQFAQNVFWTKILDFYNEKLEEKNT